MNNTLDLSQDFYEELRGFIRKRVSNQHDADDILQEALRKAVQHIDSLNDDTKLSAWLYQILRSSLIDYYRKPHREVPLDEHALPEQDALPGDNDNNDLLRCMKPLIEKLPDTYREALVKTDLEGLSQVALAEELGISVSGAKSRVQRARARLKKEITQCCSITSDRFGNILHHECHNDDCHCSENDE